jgi:ABC-2 type transport system permease protein
MPHLLELRALCGRLFLQSARRPIVLFAGLFQPFIWLFLFSAVFKNSPMATLAGATSYLAYLTPGILVFTAFTGALNGGVPILFDREQGFLDRLLVAPLHSRSSIILAAGIHILAMTLLQCAVILCVGAAMGAGYSCGWAGLSLLLVTLLLITLIFTTISLILAFSLRYHFELLSLIMIFSLPCAFLSTAFSPLAYMPAWLRYPASLNPITLAVEPLRTVLLNPQWSFAQPILNTPLGSWNLITCLGLLTGLAVLLLLMARPILNRRLG